MLPWLCAGACTMHAKKSRPACKNQACMQNEGHAKNSRSHACKHWRTQVGVSEGSRPHWNFVKLTKCSRIWFRRGTNFMGFQHDDNFKENPHPRKLQSPQMSENFKPNLFNFTPSRRPKSPSFDYVSRESRSRSLSQKS